MASAKNGVCNRCPYRRCGVETEIPYRLRFWREFCWVSQVHVASRVDTKFPYRVRILDRKVDFRDPVCWHRFRFSDQRSSFRSSSGNFSMLCAPPCSIWKITHTKKHGKYGQNQAQNKLGAENNFFTPLSRLETLYGRPALPPPWKYPSRGGGCIEGGGGCKNLATGKNYIYIYIHTRTPPP